MRATHSLARWCWAACLLGSLSNLHAQDAGFSGAIKLRLDTATQAKDNLSSNGLGFGAELRYKVGTGSIGVEVGYFYKTGDPYLQPIGSISSDSSKNPVDTAKAGDSRRNQLDGFSARVSYQSPITETWDWQAGLMLGGTRFRHQYVGDISSTNWLATDGNSWRDTYQGTPVEGGVKISPYAGVSWNMDKASSLEFNLLMLSYTAIEYVHHPGTGDYFLTGSLGPLSVNNSFPTDSLERHSRLVPHLEFTYAFHF